VTELRSIKKEYDDYQGSRGTLIRRYFGDIASDIRCRKPTPFLKWAGDKSDKDE